MPNNSSSDHKINTLFKIKPCDLPKICAKGYSTGVKGYQVPESPELGKEAAANSHAVLLRFAEYLSRTCRFRGAHRTNWLRKALVALSCFFQVRYPVRTNEKSARVLVFLEPHLIYSIRFYSCYSAEPCVRTTTVVTIKRAVQDSTGCILNASIAKPNTHFFSF